MNNPAASSGVSEKISVLRSRKTAGNSNRKKLNGLQAGGAADADGAGKYPPVTAGTLNKDTRTEYSTITSPVDSVFVSTAAAMGA